MPTLAKAAVLPLSAMPVSVQRDPWDWLLYAASLLAATAAITLFVPWALERRRRPEVRIDWARSLDGDPAKFEDWTADDAPEIIPGQALHVRVAILNVGDRASEAALTNFIVPDCFELRSSHVPEASPAYSENPTAGLPPGNRVAFMPAKLEPWTPGNWFMYSYRLIYSGSSPDQQLRTRLLFEISDSRFNRSGHRWLPGLLPPLELRHAQAGESWPPASRRAWFRWVRVAPRGRMACSRGDRRDVRDLIVSPPPQALPLPGKNRPACSTTVDSHASTTEGPAEISARSAGTVVKEPGKLAVEKLAEGSAMTRIEKREAERRKKRRKQGLPEQP